MSKASPEKSLMKRRVIYMMLAIGVLIGGGYFGWNYLANQITTRVNTQISNLAEQGKSLDCDNQRVEGFPFRVGLFCDEITYRDDAGEIFFNGGEVRSAAQFYQPGFVIGEMDGPALLKTPSWIDVNLNWKLARSSSRFKLEGLRRISIEFEKLAITGASGILKDVSITDMETLGIHFRPGGENAKSNDVEAAISANKIRFANAANQWLPPLDIKLDGVITGLNRAIRKGKDLRRWVRINGINLQVHKLELAMGNGARLTAKGPLKIARDGLLEGVLDVEVDGIQKLAESFTEQNPQLGEMAKTIRAASQLFAESNPDGIVRMKIQISRGIMTMGFFPLGTIPKLF